MDKFSHHILSCQYTFIFKNKIFTYKYITNYLIFFETTQQELQFFNIISLKISTPFKKNDTTFRAALELREGGKIAFNKLTVEVISKK